MTPPAITPALLALWQAQALLKRPEALSEYELGRAEEVASFVASGISLGLVIRLKLVQAGEIELSLNALLAQHMAQTITGLGHTAGWLDERGALRIKPEPEA